MLARLHPGYAERFDRRGGTPDDRIDAERRELGIDHALVGGVLTRRWGVHARIAEAIERHHSNEARGPGRDHPRSPTWSPPTSRTARSASRTLIEAADACGLDEDGAARAPLRAAPGRRLTRRASGPCPLSSRELDVLRRLAEGKVYKQIASELELSASTVRSHLHNVYGKLGALDRAQAVLMATEHGWI